MKLLPDAPWIREAESLGYPVGEDRPLRPLWEEPMFRPLLRRWETPAPELQGERGSRRGP